MVSTDGSAAVAVKVTPESAALESLRERLRSELPKRAHLMRRALDLAVGALDGPDPEASLGYLALLEEDVQAALSALQ